MTDTALHELQKIQAGAGKADPEKLGMTAEQIAKVERVSAAIQAKLAPPRSLNLEPLLDERRLEFGITDAAFDHQATGDRVFVFQIPMYFSDKFQGSSLYMPDQTKAKEATTAPRGIIVSAGPVALDTLRSNGIDLGHIVLFCNAAPFHVRFDMIDGKPQHLIVLTDGDIVASKDLADSIRKRETIIRREIIEKDGQKLLFHTVVNRASTEPATIPQAGWRAED